MILASFNTVIFYFLLILHTLVMQLWKTYAVPIFYIVFISRNEHFSPKNVLSEAGTKDYQLTEISKSLIMRNVWLLSNQLVLLKRQCLADSRKVEKSNIITSSGELSLQTYPKHFTVFVITYCKIKCLVIIMPSVLKLT